MSRYASWKTANSLGGLGRGFERGAMNLREFKRGAIDAYARVRCNLTVSQSVTTYRFFCAYIYT
jgi:hypothetical protein